MNPTNRLRWVNRDVPAGGNCVKTIKVLQQWWEIPVMIINWVGGIPMSEVEGEWRDIPEEAIDKL